MNELSAEMCHVTIYECTTELSQKEDNSSTRLLKTMEQINAQADIQQNNTNVQRCIPMYYRLCKSG